MKESVETQKSAIEDATTKFQILATGGGFADLIRSWAGLAVMALIISMFSKDLARLLVVVAGMPCSAPRCLEALKLRQDLRGLS